MTGTVYTVPPIPPDVEHTTWVEAGAIRIGVEYRLLDDAELAANYRGAQMDQIQEATGGNAVEDNGVSLHVAGTEDGHEYLRFDLFEREPHYHYIERSGDQWCGGNAAVPRKTFACLPAIARASSTHGQPV